MPKILILYNNNSSVIELNNSLSAEGFNTYLADDVKNGIEIAKLYSPDIIVCEYSQNGGKAGEEVVGELYLIGREKLIPIFYVSHTPSFEEMRKIISAGADDYFPHPYEPHELIKALKQRLEKYDAIKHKYESINKQTLDPPTDEPLDRDHILVNIGTKLRLVKFDDIICLTAEKEYSKITTSDEKRFIIRKSLRKWEEILPENLFIKIHRSTIINISYIDRVENLKDPSPTVYMKRIEKPFSISQRNAHVFKRSFYS